MNFSFKKALILVCTTMAFSTFAEAQRLAPPRPIRPTPGAPTDELARKAMVAIHISLRPVKA